MYEVASERSMSMASSEREVSSGPKAETHISSGAESRILYLARVSQPLFSVMFLFIYTLSHQREEATIIKCLPHTWDLSEITGCKRVEERSGREQLSFEP